jgi:hypothetical protein
MNYYPHNWVLLKINTETPFYKVLAGWRGGYLDGDSWRLNSGITSTKKSGEYYDFHGSSGNIYSCHPNNYRLSSITSGAYNQLKEKFGDKIELVEEGHWRELLGV